jgi:hypothetical protein
MKLVYDRGEAEQFDPSLYENARERVFMLFVTRMGRWLTRDELRSAGGDEAMRRVRELRDDFDYPIEMKHVGQSQYVYRMIEYQ